eukprot:5255302-Heterocapsa_arctica.AAC.1
MPHIPALWDKCRRWAAACLAGEASAQGPKWADPGTRAAKKVMCFEDDAEGRTLKQRVAALAPTVYEVVLRTQDQGSFPPWLTSRSRGRKWWPTEGQEWAAVRI